MDHLDHHYHMTQYMLFIYSIIHIMLYKQYNKYKNPEIRNPIISIEREKNVFSIQQTCCDGINTFFTFFFLLLLT